MTDRVLLPEERALIATCTALIAMRRRGVSERHNIVLRLEQCLKLIAALPERVNRYDSRSARDLIEFGPFAQVLECARAVMHIYVPSDAAEVAHSVQMLSLSNAVADYFSDRSDRACIAIGITIEEQG